MNTEDALEILLKTDVMSYAVDGSKQSWKVIPVQMSVPRKIFDTVRTLRALIDVESIEVYQDGVVLLDLTAEKLEKVFGRQNEVYSFFRQERSGIFMKTLYEILKYKKVDVRWK